MVIELKEPGNEPQRNTAVNGKMMCPLCDVPLSMSDRQGIEIDFCPTCRGVWLDRGELDKIIERSMPEIAPQRSTERREEDTRGDQSGKHHNGSKKGYRGKSWLHELFD